MYVQFTPPDDLDLSGSGLEMASLHAKVLELAKKRGGALQIVLDTSVDPKPYETCLQSLAVEISLGPTRVSIRPDRQLHITGSPEAIEAFASYLVNPPGEHAHFEHYSGHPVIHEDSLPLVVSTEKP